MRDSESPSGMVPERWRPTRWAKNKSRRIRRIADQTYDWQQDMRMLVGALNYTGSAGYDSASGVTILTPRTHMLLDNSLALPRDAGYMLQVQFTLLRNLLFINSDSDRPEDSIPSLRRFSTGT